MRLTLLVRAPNANDPIVVEAQFPIYDPKAAPPPTTPPDGTAQPPPSGTTPVAPPPVPGVKR